MRKLKIWRTKDLKLKDSLTEMLSAIEAEPVVEAVPEKVVPKVDPTKDVPEEVAESKVLSDVAVTKVASVVADTKVASRVIVKKETPKLREKHLDRMGTLVFNTISSVNSGSKVELLAVKAR